MRVSKILAAVAALASSTVYALDRKLYGINYASCPDDTNMPLDLDQLKQITGTVRMYSMDEACMTRLYWHAGWRNMKMWLGIWSEANATIDSFDGEFQRLKNLVNNKMITNDNVVGIQVASEAIYRYYIQGQQPFTDKGPLNRILQHYKDVKDYLRNQGLYFPVVITDIMASYAHFPELFYNTDVVSVNAFAMWQDKTATQGVPTLYRDFQGIWNIARKNGKPVVLHETGWSTGGTASVVRETSPEAQALYTKEFLSFAEQQNINYYYFSAFDGHRDPEIERHFGLFDNTRTMKPLISAIQVGTPATAMRIYSNGKAFKAGSYKGGDVFGALSFSAPANGLTDRLDNEIWMYNQAGSHWLKSRSTNACLEGLRRSQLQVSACDPANANQKWSFTDSGLVNDGLKTCLQSSATLGACKNTGIKKVDMAAQEIRIEVAGSQLKLTEYYGGVSVRQNPVAGAIPETQIWYYDPLNQQLKNKANPNHCLDSYEFKNNGAVHVYDCDSTNDNQQWQYNDKTGQIMHAHKLGMCLSSDASGNVFILSCDTKNAGQRFQMNL
ncbi:glucan 1,3-beta-glucosidase [Thraustotheca clavata]|uniref:glucan endo-1,3-beta-D-glucosidase n=1 Tax=Thraustotheca clavata TaxID=74557 RepID=A0A0A7CLU2_9STRA|nr:secreted protein [Thraustotheca clavata]OQS06554.1 glucan 1,3-beta-glucosidase [Thraustotheca clavata]